MVDYIIIAVIIVAAGFGIYSTVKHFKGQGGCCGGSNYKPKKKKLKNVLYQMTFRVEGMHCDHCKNRVEEVVNDMKGLAGTVNLKKGELTISYTEEVADDIIKSKIERAGYTVTEKKDREL